MERPQPFAQLEAGKVTERSVVEAFIEVVNEIAEGLDKAYAPDLLTTFQRRIVAHSVAPARQRNPILSVIDTLAGWATRLYEGAPISAAFGIDPDVEGIDVSLDQLASHDFGAVLSNGLDSMVVLDADGRFVGHECIQTPEQPSSFAPFRLAALASWAVGSRIAVVLNRLGEISVLKDEALVFARRANNWYFFTHEPVITQFKRPRGRDDIRIAVYESCLDASFARTGACVGVVTNSHLADWPHLVPSTDDRIGDGMSEKARVLRQIINGRPFQDLDRRLRQELLAIDGATLIDAEGGVLAVGAILRIDGGSTGGGRRAAAKALGALGLGLKVSQDGGVLVYLADEEPPLISIM